MRPALINGPSNSTMRLGFTPCEMVRSAYSTMDTLSGSNGTCPPANDSKRKSKATNIPAAIANHDAKRPRKRPPPLPLPLGLEPFAPPPFLPLDDCCRCGAGRGQLGSPHRWPKRPQSKHRRCATAELATPAGGKPAAALPAPGGPSRSPFLPPFGLAPRPPDCPGLRRNHDRHGHSESAAWPRAW